nr:hypothetical protein [Streptomyces aurantiacus]
MVVGHSYGGIVAAEATVGASSVRHMVSVSSYLAEPGESLSTFGAAEPPPFLDFDPKGEHWARLLSCSARRSCRTARRSWCARAKTA